MEISNVSREQFDKYLQVLIPFALAEDIGEGDHTSLATIPDNQTVTAKLLVKDEGIIAGIELAEKVFGYIDTCILLTPVLKDGDPVKNGDIAFYVTGPARSILTGERTVLNFMQRLSGIATKTSELVSKVAHTGVKLLDTRKTTPGLRLLEKWAVQTGGGHNHRTGLYDMILVKDNHVDYAGGVTEAVKRVKRYLKENKLDLQIEVEIRNLHELGEVLKLEGIDRLLLDNFGIEGLKEAVKIVNKKFFTEASGGINENNIVKFAETGVDYISSGALTYSVRSLDLSLKIVKK